MPRTTLKRHPERTQALEQAHEILRQGLLLHCAYQEGEQPYIIPFSYHFDGEAIYLHGSPKSHTLQTLATGIPMSFEVTLLDGLVYSRQAFHHSMNYRSVVGFGKGAYLEDPQAQMTMFEDMLSRCYPGRQARVDYALPTPEQLKATLVVRIEIDRLTAKARSGPPTGPGDDQPFAPGKAGVYKLPEPRYEVAYEVQKPPYWISTEKSKLDKRKILSWLQKSYWTADITAENLEKRIQNSLCFGLYKDAEQVGFARLLTDHARAGYLADVILDENHQGQGLGTWLMQHVLKHPVTQTLTTCFLSTQDAHPFYQKLGFTPHPNPQKIMIFQPEVVQ